MARLARVDVPVLARLARELRYAPREALLRQVERAEGLASELEDERAYPDEWVEYRVTGYRTERREAEPSVTTGAALRRDLSAFVERLSAAARVSAEEMGIEALGTPELCARWSVSRRTLERFRRDGLLARRVYDGGARGRARVVFLREHVERFERAHAEALRSAAAYTRIEPSLRRRIVSRGARYQRVLGWSEQRSAERLGERFGRSREAVRKILRESSGRARAATLDARARRVLVRASRLGVGLGTLGGRFSKSQAAVRRALNLGRLEAVLALGAALEIDGSMVNAFSGRAAEREILGVESVRRVAWFAGEGDVLRFIAWARERLPSTPGEERARWTAYHYLRWRARERALRIDAMHPSSEELDEVETWLRWAGRLKSALLEPQWRVALQGLETRAGCALDGLRVGEARRLLGAGLRGLSEAVDAADPFRGARLAGAAVLAVDRHAARVLRASPTIAAPGRAQPRLLAGATWPMWTRRVAAWQRWLEPPMAVVREMERGELLTARFGLGVEHPRTLRELAAERETTIGALAIRERKGVWGIVARTVRPGGQSKPRP